MNLKLLFIAIVICQIYSYEYNNILSKGHKTDIEFYFDKEDAFSVVL
jgi:hypothetical protein